MTLLWKDKQKRLIRYYRGVAIYGSRKKRLPGYWIWLNGNREEFWLVKDAKARIDEKVKAHVSENV